MAKVIEVLRVYPISLFYGGVSLINGIALYENSIVRLASVGLTQARPDYLTVYLAPMSLPDAFTTEHVAISNETQSLLLCIRKREEVGGGGEMEGWDGEGRGRLRGSR